MTTRKKPTRSEQLRLHEPEPQTPPVARKRPASPSPMDRLLDAAIEIQQNPDAVERAYMARQLVQCTLPHSDPGDQSVWVRTNGHLTLAIRPNVDLRTRKPLYPYGSIPRLLLFWIVTEATQKKSRRIHLGNSLDAFMREIGLNPRTGGGKRGDAKRLHDQMERLFRSTITFEDRREWGKSYVDMQVAPRGQFWWDPSRAHQDNIWESWVELGEDFFAAITAAPVPRAFPTNGCFEMSFGSMPNDGGYLLLSATEAREATSQHEVDSRFIRTFGGAQEFIRGIDRRCLWVNEDEYGKSLENRWLRERFGQVSNLRTSSNRVTTKQLASVPYRFGEVRQNGREQVAIIPAHSSEGREYLPVGLMPRGSIGGNSAFVMLDAPLWNLALIASKVHLVWIATVCGKIKTDFRYSNTLGWNTFPVPTLTEQNKADLTRCAEAILLAREAHFPATIADLYQPETDEWKMPANLRAAHEANDETLERIYIGRRFKNDTERLETLFAMYAKMTEKSAAGTKVQGAGKKPRAKRTVEVQA